MFKSMHYVVFCGEHREKTPEEFIDWASERGLDGVELSFGDYLPFDITQAECQR